MNNLFFIICLSLISYPIFAANRSTVPSAGAVSTPNGSFEYPVITSSNGFVYHPANSMDDDVLIELFDSVGRFIQKRVKNGAIDVHELSP